MGDPSAWSDRLAARWPDTERRRSLAAGLGFGASAALLVLTAIVVIFVYDVLTSGGPYLQNVDRADSPRGVAIEILVVLGMWIGVPLAAGLGAALSGAPLWWLLVEKPNDPPKGRGTLAGALVGILAHPVMWLVGGVGAGLAILVVEGPSALIDVLPDLGGLLVAGAMYSVIGLLLTGIVTVPVAAGTGLALEHVRKRALETESEPGERRPEDL